MTQSKARVLIVGYGVVGKRVADAVARQKDMEVAAVVDVSPSALVHLAADKGFAIYAANLDAAASFASAGIETKGTLSDALKDCDLVIDMSPGGVATDNVILYKRASKPFILNGGEKSGSAIASFSALANYCQAIGAASVRVVSCNTTALCRVLVAVESVAAIDEVFVAAVRRAADPVKTSKGPINAIVPTLGGLSHHGPDVQEVLPHIRIRTMAVDVPTTLSHVHLLHVKFQNLIARNQIVEALRRTPRVWLVRGEEGVLSSAHVMELGKDLLRPRGDVWEVVVWADSIHIEPKELFVTYCVHMESIVVPENVDCVRAMLNLQDSAGKSIQATDKALGCYQESADYSLGWRRKEPRNVNVQ